MRLKMDYTIRLILISALAAVISENYVGALQELEDNPFDSIRHPLDPLSPSEIQTTASLIRLHNHSTIWIFNRITLQEPPKAVLLPYFLRNEKLPLSHVPRKAFAILLDKHTLAGVEVIVNLSERRVESWTDLPGSLQPASSRNERNQGEEIAKADGRVQERCRQLGWYNMSLVMGDVWPVGYIGDRKDLNPENRLVQSFFFGKMFPEDNEFVHPFDFVAIVDLKNRKVVSIENLPTTDSGNSSLPNTVPRACVNWDYRLLGGEGFLRKDLVPIKVTQPGGPSFATQNYLVQWQKFQFRVGFNGHEGLVIHQVGYYDNNSGDSKQPRFRPVFYRLSLAETFIPYGDPRPPFHRKGAYDMGELGIGVVTNELNKDRDCLGQNVKFYDGYVNDPNGQPTRLKRAICIFEEDVGLLWKHTDYRTGKTNLARSQRLNVAFIATVGNYDYIFTWHFYQDARIEYEVRLTGIVHTNLAAPKNVASGHGTIVAEQVHAQYHQHIFAMRIDPEVDGNHNTVGTLDVLPGQSDKQRNPYGQAITTRLTKFRTAPEARSYNSPSTSRTWLMMNSRERNPISNTPTAYKLIPKVFSRFLVSADSPLYPKGEFSEFDVWVTPYVDGQLYAGGLYLNESGLPEWTRQAGDKSIEDADVVLWHIFRLAHVTRVEDAPTMPYEAAGFTLKPFNFFNQNPALDVSPPLL